MNKLYNLFIFFLLSLGLTACNSYLNSDSADLLIPKSVDDYSPLLLGEGYPNNFGSQLSFVDLMTDDVEMGPLYYGEEQLNNKYVESSSYSDDIDPEAGYGQYAHIWAQDYSDYLNDTFWNGRYANILTCNTIIDALPSMKYTETQIPLYRKLAAQAYTLRAFNYFCLINVYALPYSTENLDKPGVILKTDPAISTKHVARSSIKDIYALINDDIKKAQSYIDGASTEASKFEITIPAIYFLAARIALFQNDWDTVIDAGKKFLNLNSSITDLNNIDSSLFGIPSSMSKSYCCTNNIKKDEVVFGFGRNDYYNDCHACIAPYSPYSYHSFGFHTSWTGENSLLKQYDSDDLRFKAYFEIPCKNTGSKVRKPEFYAGQYHPFKCDNYSSRDSIVSQCWRTPEVYLDMAEAYAQKSSGVSSEAISYLNALRLKKYVKGSTKAEVKASDFASKDELIKFIWKERRRELCFEELMRFWDLRREGMPSQTHNLYATKSNFTTYVLKAGSPNYVLTIPTSETEYNNIENNERETIGSSNGN